MRIKELLDPKKDGKLGEAVRFGIVGAAATAIQYAIYVVGVDALGLTPVVSTICSYVVSMAFNFVMSSYFTFNARPSARRGIGFLASHAINLTLQTLLVALFQNVVSKTLALLPAMAICVPINFLLVRFVMKR